MQFDASLSNDELLARMPVLASCERGSTADVIEHLMEIDRRKLYLGQACSSLSAYCRERLDYSEDEAGKRVRVARLAQDRPQVLNELRAGRIHLTGLFLLAPHVTGDNADALLSEARGKSRREIERLIAAYFPRPNVEESVTPTVAPTSASSADQLKTLLAWSEGADRLKPLSASTKAAERLKPLSASTLLVQFTASSELYAKIERARELLSHAIPGGELAAVLERAVDELIRCEEKRRLGAGVPRKRRPLKEGSRHVPVEVARAVWQRDGARCSFIDCEGRRCSERRFITIEHKVPFARGGAPSVENLCLLCGPHNSYTAELAFGAEHVDRKKEESRRKQLERRERVSRAKSRSGATPASDESPPAKLPAGAMLTSTAKSRSGATPGSDESPPAKLLAGAMLTSTAKSRSGATPGSDESPPAKLPAGAVLTSTAKPMAGLEQVEVDAHANARARVLSALCGMGFGRREATRALDQLGRDGEKDPALLLRRALSWLVPKPAAARRP